MKPVRIGIIGVGNIANNAHIPMLLQCEQAEITAICDVNEDNLRATGDRLGLDEAHRFFSYQELIACQDVDAVEICTPNYLHVPMALDVLAAGKKLNIEKPLGISAQEVLQLGQAMEKCNAEAMMCYSYRFKPAVRYAKALLEEGILGKILDVQVQYLKDSALIPGRKLEWRFIKRFGGTGVLGDLGAHLIDMARLLIGEFKAVCGSTQIIVKERQRLDGSGMGPVETDDECSFLAEMGDGVPATFHITRAAYGHHNTILYDIYGENGMISFNLDNPTVLGVACPGRFPDHPQLHDVEVPQEYGLITQEGAFVDFVLGKKCHWFPSVKDGIRCQMILDAVERSAQQRRWITL